MFIKGFLLIFFSRVGFGEKTMRRYHFGQRRASLTSRDAKRCNATPVVKDVHHSLQDRCLAIALSPAIKDMHHTYTFYNHHRMPCYRLIPRSKTCIYHRHTRHAIVDMSRRLKTCGMAGGVIFNGQGGKWGCRAILR